MSLCALLEAVIAGVAWRSWGYKVSALTEETYNLRVEQTRALAALDQVEQRVRIALLEIEVDSIKDRMTPEDAEESEDGD